MTEPGTLADFLARARLGSGTVWRAVFYEAMDVELAAAGYDRGMFQLGLVEHAHAGNLHHHELPGRYSTLLSTLIGDVTFPPYREFSLTPQVYWSRAAGKRASDDVAGLMERGFNALTLAVSDCKAFYDEWRAGGPHAGEASQKFHSLVAKMAGTEDVNDKGGVAAAALRERYPRVDALKALTGAPLPDLKEALQERLAEHAERRLETLLGRPSLATSSGEEAARDGIVRASREAQIDVARASAAAAANTAYAAGVRIMNGIRVAGSPQWRFHPYAGGALLTITPPTVTVPAPTYSGAENTVLPAVIRAFTPGSEPGDTSDSQPTWIEEAVSDTAGLAVTVAAGSTPGVATATCQWAGHTQTEAATVRLRARNVTGASEIEITVPVPVAAG